MNSEAHQKVQAEHLSRNAFLYVRQSTPRQVRENVESTKRQYALRDQAIALGGPREQIVVIDCDQGQSGSSAVAREGFQKLVTEVGMNRAGIVMGLEVSRLARNSSDWHRLLEICALTQTLLLDKCDAIKNVERLMRHPDISRFRASPNFTFMTDGCIVSFQSTNERKRHAEPNSSKGTCGLPISPCPRAHRR